MSEEIKMHKLNSLIITILLFSMSINIYSLFLLPPYVRGIRVSSKSGIQTGVNSYLILFFFIYSSNLEVSIPIFLMSAKVSHSITIMFGIGIHIIIHKLQKIRLIKFFYRLIIFCSPTIFCRECNTIIFIILN